MLKEEIKKVTSNRKHSITGSYGMKDAFAYYKKIRPKSNEYVIDQSFYSTIIREVNKLLLEHYFTNGELVFPLDMGRINIFKSQVKPKVINGELIYNAPINWKETLELWENDNEARLSKILVRVKPGSIYRTKYYNKRCKFKNKEYFCFRANRTFKNKFKTKIRSKEEFPYKILYGNEKL